MKTLVLLICALFSINLLAQDWEPFVVGKTYYYAQPNEAESVVLTLTRYAPNGFDYYFHPSVCVLQDIILEGDFIGQYSSVFGKQFMFAFTENEESYYTYLHSSGNGFHDFIFKRDAAIGESWESGPVTIEYVSQDVMTILGQEDSVRIYHILTSPYDTSKIILSKFHGFVRLPNFHNFETTNTSLHESDYFLAGLHDTLSSIGYKQPSFKDYFALHTGDLLYWKEDETIYIPVMTQKTTYYIDTLQEVIYTDDTIQYITRRGVFDEVGEFVDSYDHTETFLQAREGQLLEAHAGWFERSEISFGFEPYYGIKPFTLHVEAGDTMTSNCFESAFYDFFEFGCSIQPYFDNSETFCYSTPIGVTSIETSGLGGHYNLHLIGSIINGIPTGIIEIPSATSEISLEKLNVYPNPVKDILHIPSNAESIRIFSMHGTLMLSFQVSNTSIDISDFAPGIYVLQLIDQAGNSVITCVIKQ